MKLLLACTGAKQFWLTNVGIWFGTEPGPAMGPDNYPYRARLSVSIGLIPVVLTAALFVRPYSAEEYKDFCNEQFEKMMASLGISSRGKESDTPEPTPNPSHQP